MWCGWGVITFFHLPLALDAALQLPRALHALLDGIRYCGVG